MVSALPNKIIDRRSPDSESRRRSDCFPTGGMVAIAISLLSLLAFSVGLVVGAWVW